MINPSARSCTTWPSTTPSTSGAGSAQSNVLDHKKITDFFYEYRARWINIAYAFGLTMQDVDAINLGCRFPEDSMNSVLSQVLDLKQAAGEELSLQDIRLALEKLRHNYVLVLPLEKFEGLIGKNPNHFYCEPTRRPEPLEPENPPPAVTDNPAEIQQLKQALEKERQDNAVLRIWLRESTDEKIKMRRDLDNQVLKYQSTKEFYEGVLISLQAENRQNSQRWEQEKQVLLHHISQQQQQTLDSVSDSPALADRDRERQGSSVVVPAASDKPLGQVAIVAPRNAGVSPRPGPVTLLPSLQDTKIEIGVFSDFGIESKLRFYWSDLLHAFNSARAEFSGSCPDISDLEFETIRKQHTEIDGRYQAAVEKMLAHKNMTYGDFERQ